MNSLADRMRYARSLKGWTQAQLAVEAKVSNGTVGNIEAGTSLSKGSIPQLAEALGVSYGWLKDGTGSVPMPSGALTKMDGVIAPSPPDELVTRILNGTYRLVMSLPSETRISALMEMTEVVNKHLLAEQVRLRTQTQAQPENQEIQP